MVTTGTEAARPLEPSVAQQLLDRVDAFFSDFAYATRGTLLTFHEGAGMIPTPQSTKIAFETWGNHTHGIGEGNMNLPEGLTWKDVQRAGLTDMRNGLLRVDLLKQMAVSE